MFSLEKPSIDLTPFKFIPPPEPYSDYRICTVTYDVDENRRSCCLQGSSMRNDTRTSYARFMYNIDLFNREGRLIPNNLVVDHINNNSMDDRYSNFQLLTSEENTKKWALDVCHRLAWIACPSCGKLFSKWAKNTSLVPSLRGMVHCCSRSCSSRFQFENFSEDGRAWFSSTQIIVIVSEYNDNRVYLTGVNNLWFDAYGNFMIPYPDLNTDFYSEGTRFFSNRTANHSDIVNMIKPHIEQGLSNYKIAEITGLHRSMVQRLRTKYL